MERLSDGEAAAQASVRDSDRHARPTTRSRAGRKPKGQPEPGISLEETVRTAGPLGVEETQELGSTLASLLIRLHTAGQVHGDIRPATVVLTSKGARLADGDPFRQAAIVSDSVYFVAPELLENPGALSAATDVFALGAVLAFAATGVSPLGSRPVTQPADGSAAPDLSAVPEALRRVIERCLDGNGAARPTAIALSILFAARLTELPAAVVPASVVPASVLPAAPTPSDTDPKADTDAEAETDAEEAAVADADAAADIADDDEPSRHVPLLERPLFFFVRGQRPGRTAAIASALMLAATAITIASSGVFGEGSKSAAGPDVTTPTSAPSTHSAAPATSSSSSSTAPPAAPGSSSTPPPAPAKTTPKAPAPPTTRPTAPAGNPVVYMGHGDSAPAAPGDARIVSGYVMTADVSWASVPGATTYEVSYSGSVSGGGTVTTSGTSATLKGLFPSEQLCAKVRSVNQYGASAWVPTSSCIMVI